MALGSLPPIPASSICAVAKERLVQGPERGRRVTRRSMGAAVCLHSCPKNSISSVPGWFFFGADLGTAFVAARRRGVPHVDALGWSPSALAKTLTPGVDFHAAPIGR